MFQRNMIKTTRTGVLEVCVAAHGFSCRRPVTGQRPQSLHSLQSAAPVSRPRLPRRRNSSLPRPVAPLDGMGLRVLKVYTTSTSVSRRVSVVQPGPLAHFQRPCSAAIAPATLRGRSLAAGSPQRRPHLQPGGVQWALAMASGHAALGGVL